MSDVHLTPDELAAVRDAPAADPRRQHAEECPRCGAMLASYVEFVADPSVPAGADPADAATRMRRAFRAELGTGPAIREGGGADEPFTRRLIAALLAPALRPAWATLLLVVLAGGGYLAWRSSQRGGDDVLRAESARHGFDIAGVARTAGGIVARWPGVPGAARYEVVLLDSTLGEIGRLPAGMDTSIAIGAAALARPGPRGPAAAIQVVAMGDEQPIATTPPHVLPTR